MKQLSLKLIFILHLFVPTIVLSQEIQLNEIFHKELPSDVTGVDHPVCQVCHIDSFQTGEPAEINTTLKSLISNPTHGSASLKSSTDDSFSLACLNCHDGICAQNAPVKLPGCISDLPNKENLFISIESHPIFNRYPYEKKEFRSMGESLPGTWKKAQTINDLLRGGKIVCTSCHYPHFTKKTGFLRAPMNKSQLCLGCHKK